MLQKNDVLKGLADFFFPPLCLGCGEFDETHTGICRHCQKRLDRYGAPICLECFSPLPESFFCEKCKKETVPIFVYARYTAPMKDAIIHFKFRGITLPASFFPPLLAESFRKQIEKLNAAALVPIPLAPNHEKERGYNQAALLAQRLSSLLDILVREDVLLRVKQKKPQVKVAYEKRFANIRNAFAAMEQSEAGERVILVDDVVTSGATVHEARRELTKAGFVVCGVIALAHGR